MTEPTHCPGLETFKSLKPLMLTCPNCGTENEIFADEKDKTQVCTKCNTKFKAANNTDETQKAE